jgi:hypothetical protein
MFKPRIIYILGKLREGEAGRERMRELERKIVRDREIEKSENLKRK